MRDTHKMLSENMPARPTTALNKRPMALAIGLGYFPSLGEKRLAVDCRIFSQIKSAI